MRRMLLVVLVSLGCGDPDPAPSAAIIEVTPDSLDPALDDADDLTIRLEYADGDADLGGGTAAVHDCRADGLVVELLVPPLASDEAVKEGVPIEGVLDLIVNDVGWIEADAELPSACEDLGAPELSDGDVVFCVVLTDAAGHSGDGDCSPRVTIAAQE